MDINHRFSGELAAVSFYTFLCPLKSAEDNRWTGAVWKRRQLARSNISEINAEA
jgi:hypothetical protein